MKPPSKALAALIVYALATPVLMAQEVAGDEATQVKLIDMVKAGGWAMYPLGIFLAGLIGLIIFGFIQFNKGKFLPDDLRLQLIDHMQNCRVRSAIETASVSTSFLGRMMAHALPKVDATDPETLGRDAVEDSMAEFTVREQKGYLGLLTYFSVIAQAAPMMGLLGTVSGMIKAFSTLEQTGGADPSALSGNISEALVTTASGLIIAIPALLAFFFFRNLLTKFMTDSHIAAGEMLDASVVAVNGEQVFAKIPEGLAEEEGEV
ncbi:MAG: MotA/TolQ/ExbB proton channel family protein [Verrucomicrobiota bacterium]